MKVLITGGCGYIGSQLVPFLAKHLKGEDQIVIYDNLSNSDPSLLFRQQLKNKNIQFIKGDILDSRSLSKALRGVDVVVHLAAKITQPFTDVQLDIFDQANHWGTASVVDAIDDSDVKLLINMSTIVVYGTSENDLKESSIPEPITYYGVSKLKAEQQVQRIRKCKAINLRTANVYGYAPAMRIDSVINRFMFEAHYFGQVNRVGDGNQSRAFLHIDKLCQAIFQMLHNEIPSGNYNLAELNLSVNEVLDKVMSIYPNLDVITLNQDAKLAHLNIALPSEIMKYIQFEERSFIDELKEMNQTFSF
ncbi:MAG: NAD-dependent epimerase/dehydratase [Bacteroidia bacterium]